MTWTSGEIITANRLIDLADQNQISGFVGLDGLKSISNNNVHRMRTMMGGFGNNYTVVQGTWGFSTANLQTDFDDILVPSAGTITNIATHTDLDEIKWPNITLNAGSYTIKVSVEEEAGCGILELLHGTTSIGTADTYDVGSFNIIKTFTYTPTTRMTADFRLRVNGTNQTNYYLYVSRIEIFKTA